MSYRPNSPRDCGTESLSHRKGRTFATIWLSSATFNGTLLKTQHATQDYPVLALCEDPTASKEGGHNKISTVAFNKMLGLDSSRGLSRWAEKETVHVTIGWRLESDGTLFETPHVVTPDNGEPCDYAVIFIGDIDWARRAANHIADFNRPMNPAEVAFAAPELPPVRLISSTPYEAFSGRSSMTATPVMTPRSRSRSRSRGRSWSPTRSRRHSRSPPIDSGVFLSTAARARRRRDRLQASQRLIQEYERHANNVFRATGNPSDALRVLDLSRRLVASQVQQSQQGGDSVGWAEKP